MRPEPDSASDPYGKIEKITLGDIFAWIFGAHVVLCLIGLAAIVLFPVIAFVVVLLVSLF